MRRVTAHFHFSTSQHLAVGQHTLGILFEPQSLLYQVSAAEKKGNAKDRVNTYLLTCPLIPEKTTTIYGEKVK